MASTTRRLSASRPIASRLDPPPKQRAPRAPHGRRIRAEPPPKTGPDLVPPVPIDRPRLARRVPGPAPPVDQDIVISVNQDRSIEINSQPVTLDHLQERLQTIFATRANKVIFVRGHQDLQFLEIARVIDIAKGAGVFKVGLMTE